MHDIEYVLVDPNEVEIDTTRHEGTEQFDRLVENVGQFGVLQCPAVRREGGVLKAIFGNGRLGAARKLGMKQVRVGVLTKPIRESDYLALTLAENFVSLPLSLRDQVERVAEYARTEPGLTGKQAAARIGLSEPKYCRLLAIAEDPAASEAVRAGRLTAESAYSVAKAPDANKAGVLALALNGATREELARASKQKPAAEKPDPAPDKKTRIVCPVGESGVRVTVSGPAFEISGLIKALEVAASMARKAERDNLTVKLANETWKRQAAGKGRKAGA